MRDDVIGIAVEQVSAAVLDALARDEAPTAAALRFLLRRYASSGRDDIRDRIEPALGHALEIAPAAPAADRPGWLTLFAEAAEASGDDRLSAAAAGLVATVRGTWGRDQPLDLAAAGLDACFRATTLVTGGAGRDLIQAAIDELERIVSPAYRPGEGVSTLLTDQIAVASALLSAYQHSGRLPYSMLAEELLQTSRRASWDGERGGFLDSARTTKPFAINCETVLVLSRLAALHRAEDYRAAAVLTPGADYGDDASRILELLAAEAPTRGLAGAVYGLAAVEYQSVL